MAESYSPSDAGILRKRRKTHPESLAGGSAEDAVKKWRTETEQQIYSSKLVNALRHLHRPESSHSETTGRVVRDAADRVLAVSARGKTRWSRAILTGRLSRGLSQLSRKHKKAAKPCPDADLRRKKTAARKKLPPLQKKVKVLSRLVPGCRKLPLPNLLLETTDYIAALEMQIKAMTFLTALLNGGASAAAAAANA